MIKIKIFQDGFCIRILFGILELKENLPIEEDLNLLIENKGKIFDEIFPYKEKYDHLNKIPDWLLMDND